MEKNIQAMKMEMNIKGIGTDIIEINRIKEAILRKGDDFLNRLFTKKELEYSYKFKDPYPRLAARFAAKEAIVKALGVGFGKKASFLDIEIINDSNKAPCAILSPSLNSLFNNPIIHLSISHCKSYATAFAIYSSK
jgi:holo-[acyl-carrier protein] synthase